MSETIVVHGYVGSGKSTQCSRLVSEGVSGASRVQHVSAGNRLRGIRNGTEASKFSQYINDPDAPSPLPDWIVEGAVFEAIDSNDSLALIDGYPRHPQAVDSFYETVAKSRHRLLGTVAMQLSIDASVERIVSRGKRDGEKMQGDDIREFARHRYQLDTQTTNLAINALSQYAPVRHVDADGDISTVYSRFVRGIEDLRR